MKRALLVASISATASIAAALSALSAGVPDADAKSALCGPRSGAPDVAGPCLIDINGNAVMTPEAIPLPGVRRDALEVKWSAWTSASAVGRGAWEYPGPEGYEYIPFRVKLSKPVVCPPKDDRAYPVTSFSALSVSAVRKRDAKRLPRSVRRLKAGDCSYIY